MCVCVYVCVPSWYSRCASDSVAGRSPRDGSSLVARCGAPPASLLDACEREGQAAASSEPLEGSGRFGEGTRETSEAIEDGGRPGEIRKLHEARGDGGGRGPERRERGTRRQRQQRGPPPPFSAGGAKATSKAHSERTLTTTTNFNAKLEICNPSIALTHYTFQQQPQGVLGIRTTSSSYWEKERKASH